MELTPRLEPEDALPLYQQLYRYIADEIAAGRIPEATRLPSRRALSAHLKISGSTVDNAYALLSQEGYVQPEAKRGYFVQALLPLPAAPRLPPAAREKTPPQEPAFDFSTSATDAQLFPFATWSKLHRETLQQGHGLLRRGDPRGDWELRQALSDFLYQYRGARAEPERVVVGAGADYLLGVLLQLLPPGTPIAAEDPGYGGLWRACQRLGLPLVPLPGKEGTLNASQLEESGCPICYVTPSHQFPLGTAMPIGGRSQLLHWTARRPGRFVIEDDYHSEFRHFQRPLPALQGLSGEDRVAYIGTFSRSLAPSMRLAYMILPEELMAPYRRGHHRCGDTVSRFEQQTLARFISEGYYQRHLRRAGNAYAKRLARFSQLLLQIPGARVSGQEAGLHFLLTVPALTEADLVGRAQQAGIQLRGLSEYALKAKVQPSTVVMGFAGLRDSELEQAVAALRDAWGV